MPGVDDPPATVDTLIDTLHSTVDALEAHIAAMNYPGTDEFDAHTISTHPFGEQAPDLLAALAGRVAQLSDDFYSAGLEEVSFAALDPKQQSARTVELTDLADAARIEDDQRVRWRSGARDRETLWSGLPPEATAPGRCHESVTQCRECGGPVETVHDIRRCWACFRRGQDGR
jgi:hypothetical protein